MTIAPRLQTIFEAVFGPDALPLSDQDSAETVKGWDSLGHLSLILALEAEFGIQFDSAEIADLVTVRGIQERLLQQDAALECQ